MVFSQNPQSLGESTPTTPRLMPLAVVDDVSLTRGEIVQSIEELAELVPFGDELELPRRRVWARLNAELQQSVKRNAVA